MTLVELRDRLLVPPERGERAGQVIARLDAGVAARVGVGCGLKLGQRRLELLRPRCERSRSRRAAPRPGCRCRPVAPTGTTRALSATSASPSNAVPCDAERARYALTPTTQDGHQNDRRARPPQLPAPRARQTTARDVMSVRELVFFQMLSFCRSHTCAQSRGVPGQIRTAGLALRRRSLYPTELRGRPCHCSRTRA